MNFKSILGICSLYNSIPYSSTQKSMPTHCPRKTRKKMATTFIPKPNKICVRAMKEALALIHFAFNVDNNQTATQLHKNTQRAEAAISLARVFFFTKCNRYDPLNFRDLARELNYYNQRINCLMEIKKYWNPLVENRLINGFTIKERVHGMMQDCININGPDHDDHMAALGLVKEYEEHHTIIIA